MVAAPSDRVLASLPYTTITKTELHLCKSKWIQSTVPQQTKKSNPFRKTKSNVLYAISFDSCSLKMIPLWVETCRDFLYCEVTRKGEKVKVRPVTGHESP